MSTVKLREGTLTALVTTHPAVGCVDTNKCVQELASCDIMNQINFRLNGNFEVSPGQRQAAAAALLHVATRNKATAALQHNLFNLNF